MLAETEYDLERLAFACRKHCTTPEMRRELADLFLRSRDSLREFQAALMLENTPERPHNGREAD